jgi:hypothetical protein
LSDGGSGAPGIPHPAAINAVQNAAAIADARAANLRFLSDCMALSV